MTDPRSARDVKTMKALIIGGGLAGTMAAKTLRELDGEVVIKVLSEEKFNYYPRPNLVEFLAGRLPYEKLFAFADGWAGRQRIEIVTGASATGIAVDKKKVVLKDGGEEPYDTLLLATGARASVPDIPGRDQKGVFVLRTLDDARSIIDGLPSSGRVVVLGGGLLGLEIARAVGARGTPVTVVEYFDRLLPRQLDERGSSILLAQIKAGGVEVKLGARTERFVGDGTVKGLRFADGSGLEAGMVIAAAGVVPETGLAAAAGAAVKKGILVDDRLRTNVPDILAAGDCAEHRGRIYGIIPASFEQGRTAAYNMLKMDKPYFGTVPSATLKAAGLAVTSVGEFDAQGPEYETVFNASADRGIYRKVVLKGGRLAGAIWMGDRKGSAEVARLVMLNSDVGQWKNEMVRDGFDFSVMQ